MRFAALALLVACQPPGYHQGVSADASGSGSGTADAGSGAATADGGSGSSGSGSGACSHQFQLFGYGGVSSVWLTGSFLTPPWPTTVGSGAVPMTLGSDASWAVTYPFTAGTYQYKFIVAGSMFIADPTDANVVDDGFGGHNSVYVCN